MVDAIQAFSEWTRLGVLSETGMLVSEPTEIRVFGPTAFTYEFLIRMVGGVSFALVNLCASLRVFARSF